MDSMDSIMTPLREKGGHCFVLSDSIGIDLEGSAVEKHGVDSYLSQLDKVRSGCEA